MKYIFLIIDGAAGHPLPEYGGKTSLEYASTPNIDFLAKEGEVGLTMNVPENMEPSSAIACMSLIGYDPKVYYSGRGPIEAVSMGIKLNPGDVAFRCNFVTVNNGLMQSYCAGQITDPEAASLINSLNEANFDPSIKFYPGVSYRHIMVVKNGLHLLKASCTPPHDISDKPILSYRPTGSGSDFLNKIMVLSEELLANHPVNKNRVANSLLPATSVWLFWGGGSSTEMPPFLEKYGLRSSLTSGVDLLRGLGYLTNMNILKINGVSGGLDNDYSAQIDGALASLTASDSVFIHVESPDESGHLGLFNEKVKAIESIDKLMVSKIIQYAKSNDVRVLILPDHPTPVALKTHTSEPVPYLLWGKGVSSNNVLNYTEQSAKNSSIFYNKGHNLMSRVTQI